MRVKRDTWSTEEGAFVGNECSWTNAAGHIHGCKQHHVNDTIARMAHELGGEPLLTLDAHFVRPETKAVQDILLQNGNKTGWRASSAYFQMDTEQAWMAWRKNHSGIEGFENLFCRAVENNTRFAELIQPIAFPKQYHLPEIEIPIHISSKVTSNEDRLMMLTLERIRFHDRLPKELVARELYLLRLQRELEVIANNGKVNFLPYFLIIDLEVTSYMESIHSLVGPGRGSAAGSLLSYLLKITHVDPIVWKLSFERFLSAGRIARGKFPDIDLDFGDPKLVVGHLTENFRDRFARICTTGTAKLKGAIKDVCRVLLNTGDDKVLAAEVNAICESVDDAPQGADIKKWLYGHQDEEGAHVGHLDQNKSLKDFFANHEEVHLMVDEVLGVPRSVGRHASAYCISDSPIGELVPMCNIKGEDCTQFTMGPVESLGLIKMDFLGLNTLNDIEGALKIIRERRGFSIDIYRMVEGLPEHIQAGDTIGVNIVCKKTFDEFCRGNTPTVFQFKTKVATPLCLSVRPRTLMDLANITANGRPGTMYALMEDGKTTLIEEWVARRQGERPVVYLHPDLKEILEPTDGIFCLGLDSWVHDPVTGGRVRLRDASPSGLVQSVDEDGLCVVGQTVDWVDSGEQEAFDVELEDGRTIRATHTTKFLTEFGWKRLDELSGEDYLAIPTKLISGSKTMDRDRLRILAYLIAEGNIGQQSGVEFVNANTDLLEAYERSVMRVFSLPSKRRPSKTPGTWRSSASHGYGWRTKGENGLLLWLREIGLKFPPGTQVGGQRSFNKHVIEAIFELQEDDIAFFLACYWDCDGGVTDFDWRAKTISRTLADDLQQLLDRLGQQAWVKKSEDYTSVRGERQAWGVYVWDPSAMQSLLGKHCLVKRWSRNKPPKFSRSETVSRDLFVKEVKEALSARSLPLKRGCMKYGLDPQHCLPAKMQKSKRISRSIVLKAAEVLDLPCSHKNGQMSWRKIEAITPMGKERMADLSIDTYHNFVANGVIVHNTYQEQIMAAFVMCCGFSEERADEIREAIGKKKMDQMATLLPEIRERLQSRGWGVRQVESFVSLCVAASSYSFNKSHSLCYAYLGYVCMWLKTNFKLEWWNSVLQNANFEDMQDAAQHIHDIVESPSINRSALDFYIINDDGMKLVFPINRIKNVKNAGIYIHEARTPGGVFTPFTSLEDFYNRINRRKVNKRIVASLIWSGAFDTLCGVEMMTDRNRVFREYLSLKGDKKEFVDLSYPQATRAQMELLAIGTSDIVSYIQEKVGKRIVGPAQALKAEDKMKVHLGGMCTSVSIVKTKTGKNPGQPMAFLEIQDNGATIAVTVFPTAYETYSKIIEEGRILYIDGKMQVYKSKKGLVADEIRHIGDEIENLQLEEAT
jgi:DNA polymerase-3 subunit alpha